MGWKHERPLCNSVHRVFDLPWWGPRINNAPPPPRIYDVPRTVVASRYCRLQKRKIMKKGIGVLMMSHQRAARSARPAGRGGASGSWCRISHPPSSAPPSPERSSCPSPPAIEMYICWYWFMKTHIKQL